MHTTSRKRGRPQRFSDSERLGVKVNAGELVPIESIQPSPENDLLYGAIDPGDIDLVNLANDISKSGVREPIQISADRYIVSGHRRYAASKLCGVTHVPVVEISIWRSHYRPDDWQRVLRAHNHQRVKPAHVRLKEAMLDVDPNLAYSQLIKQREVRDTDAPPAIKITGTKIRSVISSRKQEMLAAVIEVVQSLKDYWPLSDRHIHYGLLNNPPWRNSSTGNQRRRYENDRKSYGDLCDLLTRARLLGIIPWAAIADETRPVSGLRYSKDAATFADLEIYHFLRGYRRDLLQSQSDHIEIIAEKLTVQNIIEQVAKRYTMPMTVGRGYCSITPRYEISQRFFRSGKDRLVLLIASDFDPDGDEIAESFVRSMRDDFRIDDVQASKILLRQDQIREWDLPSNGLEAKETSSKYGKFVKRYGSKQVFELEAVPPKLMQKVIAEAIEGTIDLEAFNGELNNERGDAAQLQAMKNTVASSFADMSGNEGTGQ